MIPEILLITPTVFADERGNFFESFNQREFCELTGVTETFVQDNHTTSRRNVLRGLHYQIQQPQGKLIRVVRGEIFDVAVDLRRTSPTFGHHVSTQLSASNRQMLWLPRGFAHGFLALADNTEVLYKTTDYWAPEFERTLAWDDPDLAIPWPYTVPPILVEKDQCGKRLRDVDVFP